MTNKCRLCSQEVCQKPFKARYNKYILNYFECSNCSYVQTQKPIWLSEAYKDAVNASDTGIMARNTSNVNLVIATLSLLRKKKGKVVDCAGGHGILVRMLRDQGVNAFWSDPYAANLTARGFEHYNEKADLVTAFEAFEHFIYPCQEVDKFLSIAPNILLTTTLIPSPTPYPAQWWYYGLEHGQHIGFFRVKSLLYIAKKYGLHLLTDSNSIHLFTQQKRISLQDMG